MSGWQKTFSVALLIAAVSACSTHVSVRDPHIPDPLITAMPLSVGVRYPQSFDHFVHEEQVIGKEKWQIDLGASNKILFNKLFNAMFTDVTLVAESEDATTLGLDALIEPSIDAFEFSVPEQSQTDSFAVWIRYRIKIFDRNGTQIANWPINAYGKSQTSTFGGDEALRRAAVLAMRDAAALIIMQMDKSTGISKLINNDNAMPTTAEPAVQQTAVEEQGDDAR
ncbi:MAG: hypothetical protein IIB76_06675 [Proteobacteria bacterium]|nr:hypothetical protein [Pseudomonadota bacterium]